MKYYLIAGEASGDLHGANLIRALKVEDPQAVFRCWGGDRMQAEGADLVKHYKDLAFMGFVEVVMNLKTISRNLRFCHADILDFQPDAVILIDYPGFNLRIARFAHEQGFRVYYYISPQVWAWKKNRVHTIREVVDRMFTILPFEKEFYARYQVEVDYVGHPLLDMIDPPVYDPESAPMFTPGDPRPIVALLPGSRKQEVAKMLPVMLDTCEKLSNDYQFIISGVTTLGDEFYGTILKGRPFRLVYGQTYELLRSSYAAMVTSGTASLETALFHVPQVICYKGSRISFAIAKRIVNISYIGLPNLIMDRQVVTELIQSEFTVDHLGREMNRILEQEAVRTQIKADYRLLWEKLGGKGASARTAGRITELLKLR